MWPNSQWSGISHERPTLYWGKKDWVKSSPLCTAVPQIKREGDNKIQTMVGGWFSRAASMIHWTMPVWRITRNIHWYGQHAMTESSQPEDVIVYNWNKTNCVAQRPWKATWKSREPVKVTYFAWVAAKACPTRGTYRREESLLVIDSICVKRSRRQSRLTLR